MYGAGNAYSIQINRNLADSIELRIIFISGGDEMAGISIGALVAIFVAIFVSIGAAIILRKRRK
jgi:hypothetical protein